AGVDDHEDDDEEEEEEEEEEEAGKDPGGEAHGQGHAVVLGEGAEEGDAEGHEEGHEEGGEPLVNMSQHAVLLSGGTVVTVDSEDRVFEGDVLIDGGRIKALGPKGSFPIVP